MPKPQKHRKRPKDVNLWAQELVRESTSQGIVPVSESIAEVVSLPNPAQISAFMAELGRRGGLIGGKRRLETMTKKERRIAASNAAKARWKKVDK